MLVLANNRCATALNYGGTAWHKWRIYWLFCKYVVAQMYSARATLFGFLKTSDARRQTEYESLPFCSYVWYISISVVMISVVFAAVS